MHNQTSPWATAAGTLRRVGPFAAVMVVALLLAAALPHKVDALPIAGIAFAGAIMDSTALFARSLALSTGGTGLAFIGDVMDLTKARDIGNGRPLFLVITVDTAVTSAGAATVQFSLVSDGQAAIAADGSATVHYTGPAIPKATLVAGFVVAVVPLPMQNPAYEQFLGILQNVGTAALTAGKINAYLTFDPPAWKAYPNSPNAI